MGRYAGRSIMQLRCSQIAEVFVQVSFVFENLIGIAENPKTRIRLSTGKLTSYKNENKF
jgi:hypothetical protein